MTDISNKFRLYYNKVTGEPKYYTMEDLPGDFIFVDQQTYDTGRYDIKISDNKIVSQNKFKIKKYRPVDSVVDNSVACSSTDISILVNSNEEHILWQYS